MEDVYVPMAKFRLAIEDEIAVQNRKMSVVSGTASTAFMHSEMKAMLTRILSRLDNAQESPRPTVRFIDMDEDPGWTTYNLT